MIFLRIIIRLLFKEISEKKMVTSLYCLCSTIDVLSETIEGWRNEKKQCGLANILIQVTVTH